MATINGPDQSDFWSMTEVDCFVGAPLRLGGFMSKKQFDMILKVLAKSLIDVSYVDIWDEPQKWQGNKS